MTVAANQTISLEDYLRYDDGTDTRYELVDGMLVQMGAESPINNTIALFLVLTLAALGIPAYRFATGHQIEVDSERATARQPDLMVHTEASARAILDDGNLLREYACPNADCRSSLQQRYRQEIPRSRLHREIC
jgi:Uma2 family endonuclease